jgi:hypothetical protein
VGGGVVGGGGGGGGGVLVGVVGVGGVGVGGGGGGGLRRRNQGKGAIVPAEVRLEAEVAELRSVAAALQTVCDPAAVRAAPNAMAAIAATIAQVPLPLTPPIPRRS